MEWLNAVWQDICTEAPYLLRILIAALCGGAIGIERTLRQKDAGFRTHVIVALGASLMTVVSKYGFFDLVDTGISADATRIASNIITGISFLGAGMIFVKGANIKGLTTAAGVWATAAVAMALGAGLYFTGILSTVVIILIQVLFHTFLIGFDKVLSNDRTTELIITLSHSIETVEKIKASLSEHGFSIINGKTELNGNGEMTLSLSVKGDKTASIDEAMLLLSEDGIKYVSF